MKTGQLHGIGLPAETLEPSARRQRPVDLRQQRYRFSARAGSGSLSSDALLVVHPGYYAVSNPDRRLLLVDGGGQIALVYLVQLSLVTREDYFDILGQVVSYLGIVGETEIKRYFHTPLGGRTETGHA